MAEGDTTHRDGPRLVELAVADPPEAWRAAGFAVEDDRVRLGTVTVRLVGSGDPAGPDAPRGVTSWALSGVALTGDDLDGLPTTVTDPPGGAEVTAHPNGTVGLDHVVVATPDLARTLDALAAAGLDLRRVRDTTSYGAPMRQAFFRLGPVVLEVVSGDTGAGVPAADAPASWFGLAVDVDDLDATARLLGPGLGSVKPAVQAGRRIATFRHRDLGMSVAVAAMDDHGDR